jgi:hypothetical protein
LAPVSNTHRSEEGKWGQRLPCPPVWRPPTTFSTQRCGMQLDSFIPSGRYCDGNWGLFPSHHYPDAERTREGCPSIGGGRSGKPAHKGTRARTFPFSSPAPRASAWGHESWRTLLSRKAREVLAFCAAESLRVPSAVGAVCTVSGTNAADVRTAAFPHCLMVRRQAAG